MNEPNPKLEQIGALGVSFILLLSIVWTLYQVTTNDFELHGAIRVGPYIGYFFWLAILALLIADTDVPKSVYESSFLRAQVRCWGLWWLLRYAVLMVQFLPFKHIANQSFLVAGCLLAIYSVIAAFKPTFPLIFESSR